MYPGPIVLQEMTGGWKSDQDLWHFARDDIILAGKTGDIISALEYRRDIAFPRLDRMLYWYYDVAAYANRFHYSYPGCDLRPLQSTTWMRSIFKMFWRLQLCEFALVERCQFLSPANLASELLASSSIVEKEGRLRINEALMDGAYPDVRPSTN